MYVWAANLSLGSMKVAHVRCIGSKQILLIENTENLGRIILGVLAERYCRSSRKCCR